MTITPEGLARTILTVISERHGSAGVSGPRGYFGVSTDPEEFEDDMRSQLLDGRDDFVAICEEALRRLGS